MRLTSKTPLSRHGACSNRDSRFLKHARSRDEADATDGLEEDREGIKIEVAQETAKSIISYNQSPDIPFDRSVNAYRGCEHGCVYCYARPTHAYLGLSPGLDFETRLFAKQNAAELLDSELSRPGYRPAPLALGANTDPYQPIEQTRGVTRGILEVLDRCNHPVTITTKGAVIARDIDLLASMAQRNLVRVMISIGVLDPEIARRLEPRAATPQKRFKLMRQLNEAGVPASIIVAPVIPALTDRDMEKLLALAREAGAKSASYVFLRLPLEVRDLFVEWLDRHFPERAGHVMSLVRQSRGGRDYVSTFGERLEGEGVFADMIRQRFAAACRRLGFAEDTPMNLELFSPPKPARRQFDLFD